MFNQLKTAFFDWLKRNPVVASRILDAAVVAVIACLHKYGLSVPDEVKGLFDVVLVAIAGGGTVAARQSVVPSVKLSDETVAQAKTVTQADINSGATP